MTHTDDIQDKFPGQDSAVLRLVNGLAWGSLWDDIPDLEQTLQCLLYAAGTLAPLHEWESDWEEECGYSFDMTPAEVDGLSDDGRRALVADLARWLDMNYRCTGIAPLVCGLNDIINTGYTPDEKA